MLKIKDIKHGQIFYSTWDRKGFKAWKDPFYLDGKWSIEAEDNGNYTYTFTEEDEDVLYLTSSLGNSK